MNDSPIQLYCIHGHTVGIQNELAALAPALKNLLGEFAADGSDSPVVSGVIRRYERDEVVRHLSTTATQISTTRDGVEIYQDNERFWLIDDRFGLVEINLLKSQWRCWVIDEPAIDAHRVIEMAVLWPASHLLRGRGLCLLPAATVVRGDIGLMLISPLGIDGELSALLRAGYRLVGQSWSALREADGEVEMLHMSGRVERNETSSTRSSSWIDLEAEFCGSAIARGVCREVMLIEPARRAVPMLRAIPKSEALPALRRAWPISELHPQRAGGGQIPAKLSRHCNVYAMHLSQNPNELLDLISLAQSSPGLLRIAI